MHLNAQRLSRLFTAALLLPLALSLDVGLDGCANQSRYQYSKLCRRQPFVIYEKKYSSKEGVERSEPGFQTGGMKRL